MDRKSKVEARACSIGRCQTLVFWARVGEAEQNTFFARCGHALGREDVGTSASIESYYHAGTSAWVV